MGFLLSGTIVQGPHMNFTDRSHNRTDKFIKLPFPFKCFYSQVLAKSTGKIANYDLCLCLYHIYGTTFVVKFKDL